MRRVFPPLERPVTSELTGACRGRAVSWPLFQIDLAGEPKLLGRLHRLAQDQYWFDEPLAACGPLSEGLPFFLHDLIPQGFLGRGLPRHFSELALPQDIADWDDKHVLTYLCRRGEDNIGNLVLGDESLRRFLERMRAEASYSRQSDYPVLADGALSHTISGSPAGGEHPKFTASIRRGDAVRHVLVKFSPSGQTRVAQRWSDLLTSEHLATHILHKAGLTASTTELLRTGDRTFLEAERFDRHGPHGRSGLVSLAALSNHYLGIRDHWIAATASLAKRDVISHEDAQTVRRLATFGRLIANTDMHFGNLSFRFPFDGKPVLAPIYDMLPMLYAPTPADVLPAGAFEPPLPTETNEDIWKEITDLALEYWQQISSHVGVSTDFAAIARLNAQRVKAVARLI